MAIIDKDTLKSYFLTGKYPTQEQFASLIDSMRHRLEGVPAEEVAGLAALLNGKADKAIADKAIADKVQELLQKIDDGDFGGSGLTEEERALFDRFMALFEVDEAKGWLRVNGAEKRYFVALTELAAPATPTLVQTEYQVVTGNASVTVTNPTPGAAVQYSTDQGLTWKAGAGVIALPTGYTNDKANAAYTAPLWLKAVKNGEESEVGRHTLSIRPKAAAGAVSVLRNANNNDYSTSATVTLTPSPSNGAVSEYTDDGGGTWKPLAAINQVTTTSPQSTARYQVRATRTGYADADTAKSAAFVLGKRKFYYGCGPASLAAASAVAALRGGGVREKDTMAGTYSINFAEAGQYVWFCGLGTLKAVTSSGFAVPMRPVAVVDGYNCYRSVSPRAETGTGTFEVR